MVYFFQIDKNKDILEWSNVPWLKDENAFHLGEDSCRARRHQLIFRYINSCNSSKLVKSKTVLGITTNKPVENIKKCIEILNKFESKTGLKKTTYEECQIHSGCFSIEGDKWNRYIFTGSKLWRVAPPVHSLYTLLIRILIENALRIPDNFEIGSDKLLKQYSVGDGDFFEYNYIYNKLIPFTSNIKEIFGTSVTKNYKFPETDKELILDYEWEFHDYGIITFLDGYISCPSMKSISNRFAKWQENYKKITNDK